MIRKNNILVSAASLAILLSSSQMYAINGQQDGLQPQKKKSSYQVAKGITKIIVGSGLIGAGIYRAHKGIFVLIGDNPRLLPGDQHILGTNSPKAIFKNCIQVLNPKVSLHFNDRYNALMQIPLPIITGIISLWSGINDLWKK